MVYGEILKLNYKDKNIISSIELIFFNIHLKNNEIIF